MMRGRWRVAGLWLVLGVCACARGGDRGSECGWSAGFAGDAGLDDWAWRALMWRDPAGVERLVVSGEFTTAGGEDAHALAAWDGQQWSAASEPFLYIGPSAMSIGAGAGGVGQAVYFHAWGDVPPGAGEGWRVMRWDGATLEAVTGLSPTSDAQTAAWFDDGSGATAYIDRRELVGSDLIYGVLRWEDDEWRIVTAINDPADEREPGIAGLVRRLAVFDVGEGDRLYAFGDFEHADGMPIRGIAAWDGSSWSDPIPGVARGEVRLLGSAIEDGTHALYLDVRGRPNGDELMRWDGQALTPLPQPPGSPRSLAVGTSSNPPVVYIVERGAGLIWKTHEDGWIRMPESASGAYDLAVVEHEGERWLYAVGRFESIGGQPSSRIAARRLDQQFLDFVRRPSEERDPWTAPGRRFTLRAEAVGEGAVSYRWLRQRRSSSGPIGEIDPLVDGGSVSGAQTETLTIDPIAWDDQATYFVRATDECGTEIEASTFVDVRCVADLYADGVIDVVDYQLFAIQFGATDESALRRADLDADGDIDVLDFLVLLSWWGCTEPDR